MSDGGVCLIMFTVLLNVLGQAMWLTGHVYHKLFSLIVRFLWSELTKFSVD